jgi:hypothetical protein
MTELTLVPPVERVSNTVDIPITVKESWDHFRSIARALWAVQDARIALSNRTKATELHAGSVTDILEPAQATLRGTERALMADLLATMQEVAPPGILEWVANIRGIGAPSVARLLGQIGHPRIAQPMHYEGQGTKRTLVAEEPYLRTVSQLWQYCGVGDPAIKPTKGMSQEEMLRLGRPRAKALLYVISEGAIKASGGEGPYRALYDDARERYHDRVHATACTRCRAEVGAAWRPGHQHAAALRRVGKEILKDLWISAGKTT